MNPLSKSSLAAALVLLSATPAFPNSIQAANSTQAKRLFKHPPREYSTGPLWVWNDLLTEQEIRETLRDLAEQKVKQVWVHPRPGLMTPYLSADWFRLWKAALKEAERLDMNVWIYDENSYPSGFGGGLVPEAMPQSRGRGLSFRELYQTNGPLTLSSNLLGAYELDGKTFVNLAARLRAGECLPAAHYLVASELQADNKPWNANRCYVNLLTPGVTEKFLELTFEPYRREIGAQFGKRVPGVFTDEPNIRPTGGLPWSENLPAEFQKRWGYNLLDHLPSLSRPIGDWRKVRFHYFQLLDEQFIEHWSKPYHDFCETNHLEWTGHYWDHEWPDCKDVPDNMAMYAWHQRPAIDCLMNQYAEHTHAQFGNVRMVKELASVANQLGQKRTLCETYGAGGWDLRLQDMKRIGDWLSVLGINTINQHLSYVTIRGARKRDHPQSFSYHEPWWQDYHVSAEYFARLSAALSQGEQVSHLLVLEPTTTAWMYQGDEAKLKQLGDAFFKLLLRLEAAQIEYDIASEDILLRHGSPGLSAGLVNSPTTPKTLRVGQREYDALLIPPLTENLNRSTKQLLNRVAIVQHVFAAPSRLDGEPISALGNAADATTIDEASLNAWTEKVLRELKSKQAQEGFELERAQGDKGLLFHHRRQFADGELLFLVNTSLEHPAKGLVRSNRRGVESWNLYTGQAQSYPFEFTGGGVVARFDLPPAGSLLLFMSQKPARPNVAPPTATTTIAASEGVTIRRQQPNVLTLDYVEVTAGGETRTNLYCYRANQFIWKQHGLEQDPWDSAVQFKDELLAKKFAPGSGFQASYSFTLEGQIPKDLAIVIERPDLYTITCNGRPVTNQPNAWWLDKAFGRIDLGSVACPGQNVVTLKASPLTLWHELEPAYVLGSFALQPAEKGFVITAESPDRLGASCASTEGGHATASRLGWNASGYPFYSSGMEYQEHFQLDHRSGRYLLSLPDWYGSVAEVTVNGRAAGVIDTTPWELDVTKWLRRGDNLVVVTIIGTLKNTLGPHHGKPELGAAWPKAFQKSPEFGPPAGAEYSTVAYGLFRPFILKQETR